MTRTVRSRIDDGGNAQQGQKVQGRKVQAQERCKIRRIVPLITRVVWNFYLALMERMVVDWASKVAHVDGKGLFDKPCSLKLETKTSEGWAWAAHTVSVMDRESFVIVLSPKQALGTTAESILQPHTWTPLTGSSRRACQLRCALVHTMDAEHGTVLLHRRPCMGVLALERSALEASTDHVKVGCRSATCFRFFFVLRKA
mgnify:CR=1 FL=1